MIVDATMIVVSVLTNSTERHYLPATPKHNTDAE